MAEKAFEGLFIAINRNSLTLNKVPFKIKCYRNESSIGYTSTSKFLVHQEEDFNQIKVYNYCQ